MLVDRPLAAGTHLFVWDGRDDVGSPAGSGVYIYRFRRGDETAARKMLMVE
jgi:flagellar hook assembly protein FlgD